MGCLFELIFEIVFGIIVELVITVYINLMRHRLIVLPIDPASVGQTECFIVHFDLPLSFVTFPISYKNRRNLSTNPFPRADHLALRNGMPIDISRRKTCISSVFFKTGKKVL